MYGLGQTASSGDLLSVLEAKAEEWLRSNVHVTLSPQTQEELKAAYIRQQLQGAQSGAVSFASQHGILVAAGIGALLLFLKRR
jgi:hypothetical protein